MNVTFAKKQGWFPCVRALLALQFESQQGFVLLSDDIVTDDDDDDEKNFEIIVIGMEEKMESLIL